MRRHGFDEPVRHAHNNNNNSRLTSSIYALYLKNSFLGSCVAIAPDIVVSAGHHYNVNKDDVGDFSILVGRAKWMRVSYAAKSGVWDVLVLWMSGSLEHHVPLRAFLPPVNSNVATVYLSAKPPHDPIVSPGVVVESSEDGCTVRGTVSMTGSSGAPVIDFYGTMMVGLHLTSNTLNGSRVSGFLPARRLVAVLREMDVVCRSSPHDGGDPA